MPEKSYGFGDVVDAVLDLTRVTVALHGKFDSKAEAIRALSELSIPAPRIAAILSMSTGDVASSLAKARKRARHVDDVQTHTTVPGNDNAEISD